jgi:hypothetical protein
LNIREALVIANGNEVIGVSTSADKDDLMKHVDLLEVEALEMLNTQKNACAFERYFFKLPVD